MYESRIEGLTVGRYECMEVEACVSDNSFVQKHAFSNGEETAEYRADLESHPGLRQVSPAMKAFLLRHHDDDKLYLEWITPHVVVAIEEFERI